MTSFKKNVVLVHGHGVDDSIWDELNAQLSENRTVIRPSLSLYSNFKTLEEYADELHRLLTNIGIEKFTLLGHSMGGYISLAFAEKYPKMLEGFGLFHSQTGADTEEKKQQRTQTAKAIRKNGTAAFIETTVPKMYGKSFAKNNQAKVERAVKKFSALPQEALAAGLEAMRDRPDRTKVLKNLKVPVLLIIGMQDQLVPFEKSLTMLGVAKEGYPFILPEVGHLGMKESPDASFKIIDWFLSK